MWPTVVPYDGVDVGNTSTLVHHNVAQYNKQRTGWTTGSYRTDSTDSRTI